MRISDWSSDVCSSDLTLIQTLDLTFMKLQTALISVSDKTGIVEFAQALSQRGVQLLSTGGTAKLLAQAGLAVTEVANHTGSPEILDGRVKPLHPKIHGGLLARRDSAEHRQKLEEPGIDRTELLAVNMYPFQIGREHI